MYTGLKLNCVKYIANVINNFYEITIKNNNNQIQIRKLLKRDKLNLYKWFNDYQNISYKLKTKYRVTLNAHNIWLNKFLNSKKNKLWLITLRISL